VKATYREPPGELPVLVLQVGHEERPGRDRSGLPGRQAQAPHRISRCGWRRRSRRPCGGHEAPGRTPREHLRPHPRAHHSRPQRGTPWPCASKTTTTSRLAGPQIPVIGRPLGANGGRYRCKQRATESGPRKQDDTTRNRFLFVGAVLAYRSYSILDACTQRNERRMGCLVTESCALSMAAQPPACALVSCPARVAAAVLFPQGTPRWKPYGDLSPKPGAEVDQI
jgi:hypothetical protein